VTTTLLALACEEPKENVARRTSFKSRSYLMTLAAPDTVPPSWAV
jgi:hypothetical protein